MKQAMIFAVPLLVIGLAGAPAYAGCLTGAAIGGVGGHFLGHHGLIGAGAGCLIGHHEAVKHERERTQMRQQQGSTYGDTRANSNSGR